MIIGSEVHIDMYDDRLEITSPGGMLDGRKIQEVDILHVSSSRRNPVISDIFHRLKYMERRGSGIKKILKEYDEDNIPRFYSDQQYFTVTLKNKNFSESQKANGNSKFEIISEDDTQKTTKKRSETTLKNEERILRLITENPAISQMEIASRLGNITTDGVKYHLKKLKAKGILKRVGADKGGYWEIVEHE